MGLAAKVGKGLAQGWRRVGKGLVSFLAPPIFNSRNACLDERVCDSFGNSPDPVKNATSEKRGFSGHAQTEKAFARMVILRAEVFAGCVCRRVGAALTFGCPCFALPTICGKASKH